MEFFKTRTNINFMGHSQRAFLVSAVLLIASCATLFIYGLNKGLDFTGGVQIELHAQHPVTLTSIQHTLKQAQLHKATVRFYGDTQTFSVRIAATAGSIQKNNLSAQALRSHIHSIFPEPEFHISQAQFVGPQVGKKLMTHGILALVVSILATMIYIAIRFEHRFAISAVFALIHDPIVILGVFAALHLPFNLIALAALLTILGYSLNDTIVVYDRVRENFQKMPKASPYDVMNRAINDTLSRTIMTSGLTLVVVLTLLILGGETLRGFAIALAVGIVVGTYSSVYIAGSLALVMGLDRQSLTTPHGGATS